MLIKQLLQKLNRLKCKIFGHGYYFDAEAFSAEVERSYTNGEGPIHKTIKLPCICCDDGGLKISFQIPKRKSAGGEHVECVDVSSSNDLPRSKG